MDITFTPPKNNFSDIKVSSNIFKKEDDTKMTISNLKSFEIPKFSISTSEYETWGEIGQTWTQGWSEDTISNIQNFLSLSKDSYNFMLTTNFGLNNLVKDEWENSKARKEMLDWGRLKLPKIEDPYKSLVCNPDGKSWGELYGDLWSNALSGMADKVISSLVKGGLDTLGEVSKKIVTSFLGEGIVSNISNMLNIGKGLFNAGKAFGESFKSIKDAGFLIPEAGLWSGFISGDAKSNNANAKEGMKRADAALSNIEGTLDTAIAMLGGTNLLSTKRNGLESSENNAGGGTGAATKEAQKQAQKKIDKKLEALSSASTSPITATRTTQEKNTIVIAANKDNSILGPTGISESNTLAEDVGLDGFISKILLSKDVMSNMYEVVFTFNDERVNFENENIDPFVVSARVSAISIPGEEQVIFPTKFCGSNISRLDNQVNYSHQSSFEFMADDSLYYIQYLNKLAQVDAFVNNKWSKLTLDTLKKALSVDSINVSLAELPVVLSKKKINLYVRRGINKNNFRVWKFSNIRILGPGSGIGFKREGASTVNLSYDFIFSNCTEVPLKDCAQVFNKESNTGGN